jgi:8-oxo-dGTP pyrophosphatase MutT (NUDIX family)
MSLSHHLQKALVENNSLKKAEDPEAYKKLASTGFLLAHPVKIKGQSHRPDNGIGYHSSIKFFDKEGDSESAAHKTASSLDHQHIDPKKVKIEPKVLKDLNGNDVYAIGMKGPHADKMKEHHEKFGHMGHPETYKWGAHVSVPKSVHDEIKSKGHKTAHEAGMEFGHPELKRGPRVLQTYRPKMDKSGKTELNKKEKEDKDTAKIACVLLFDGHFVLIGRRRRNGKWGLPGGRFEDDEKKEDVAIRETEEETGIKIKPEDLKYLGSKQSEAKHEVKKVYVFTAPYPGGEPTTKEDPDREFDEWHWVRCEDGKLPDEILEDDFTPPTEIAFDQTGMTKSLIDKVLLMKKSEDLTNDEDSHALLNRQEDKYFLARHHLDEVIDTISNRLALGDIDTDTRYNTNRTIYLDNPDLTSFRDCIIKKKPRLKVRIRQYSPNSNGWEEVAYAEFKLKEEDGFTKKIRVRIPAEMVESLCNGEQIVLDEYLVNINKDLDRKLLEARIQAINSVILRQGLKKQVEVRYERRAYTGKNLRITIDDNLRYIDAREVNHDIKQSLQEDPDWQKFSESYIIASWENPVIMEVKSDEGVPSWMKRLLKDVNAKEASFSKYSAAMLTFFRTEQSSGNVLNMFSEIGEMTKAESLPVGTPLMKPYRSDAQRRWAHTNEGEKSLGGKAAVHEWDEASKGKKLPERVAKSESLEKALKVGDTNRWRQKKFQHPSGHSHFSVDVEAPGRGDPGQTYHVHHIPNNPEAAKKQYSSWIMDHGSLKDAHEHIKNLQSKPDPHAPENKNVAKSESISCSIIKETISLYPTLSDHKKALRLDDSTLEKYLQDNPSLKETVLKKHEARASFHFAQDLDLIHIALEKGVKEAYRIKRGK